MAITSCSACAAGSQHEVSLKGSDTKIHGLDCYVSKPAGKPTGLIVIIPDAFGWQFSNNRSLADKFAEAGFLVYLPDFHQGSSLSADLLPYGDVIMSPKSSILQKATCLPMFIYHGVPFMFGSRRSVSLPIVEPFFKALNEDERKTLKIGTAAYCWGAWYALHMNTDTPERKALADAIFTAHPSLTEEGDYKIVSKPVSIAVGSKDNVFPTASQEAVKKLFETERKDHPFEITIAPEATHGYAIRYNQHDPEEEKLATEAFDQAVAWFNKWLK